MFEKGTCVFYNYWVIIKTANNASLSFCFLTSPCLLSSRSLPQGRPHLFGSLSDHLPHLRDARRAGGEAHIPLPQIHHPQPHRPRQADRGEQCLLASGLRGRGPRHRGPQQELLQTRSDFQHELLCKAQFKCAKMLRTSLVKKLEARKRNQQPRESLASMAVTTKQLALLDFKAQEIAEQMTLLDAELFHKVRSLMSLYPYHVTIQTLKTNLLNTVQFIRNVV